MADVKTIDEILRARGREKCEQKIEILFAPLIDGRAIGGTCSDSLFAGLYGPKGENDNKENPGRVYHGEIPCRTAIDLMKKAMLERDAAKYEQAEVDAFMSKFECLSVEVANLRNEILLG